MAQKHHQLPRLAHHHSQSSIFHPRCQKDLIWIAGLMLRTQADFAFTIKMELARLPDNMTKNTCSAVFPALRSISVGVHVRCLAFLAWVAFSAGCATNQVMNFTPKSAMVCDQVRITGTFQYDLDDLDGVWFNGVAAFASFRHFPAPNGPLEILAIVPEGASNGPIRVKISTKESATFGPKGVDYTFREPFSVTGSPPVPAINSFSANPATIEPGQTSTLSWQVSPAVKQLTLDGADVSGTNSQTVSPATTTVYYLVAKNESCLKRSQAVAVTVMPSPQPASIVSGPVKPQAVANSDARKTNTIALEARKNGPFVDIKSKIGFASQTCGSRQLQVSTNVAGLALPGLAVFRQDGAILAQHNFQPDIIGGAAFSPGGDQAVSVTADPNGFSASYVEVIERFATHYRFQFPVNVMEGFKTATNRWHVLFSPDDTLVMVSSVPVGSPAKIAVQVHDMARRKNIGPLIQADCAACDLQGEVINENTVTVKLDGAVVATFPIQ